MRSQGSEHLFFRHYIDQGRIDGLCILLVTHLLPDRPRFIEALGQMGRIAAILPKPKSVHAPTLEWVSRHYPVCTLNRQWTNDPDGVIAQIAPLVAPHERLIILDIGGYFAKTQATLSEYFGPRFLGVVEMTENGHQRYEQEVLATPVVSVARSPLKQAEDIQIGLSVVYSAESLARTLNRTFNVCEAALFGYGKVGRSIARDLRCRNLHLGLVETDVLRQVEALSHGFRLITKEEALRRAELVICSTGNGSLDLADLQALRPGTMVASVTSADDEFAFCLARLPWPSEEVCPHVLALNRPDGSQIYLLNRGEAVNFVHGAVIGEYVYLVLAEIMEGIRMLAAGPLAPSLLELPESTMRAIARHWLTDFHGVTE
ncbi:adenosylhomocysteinase [Aeromonas enteropelogenes]|uniref:adenosylhomocysteinase n=1 Tax=Aeromonas enteropelogenes TaxID=29489 RepID=UPI001CBDD60B|nr:adenosylhomocysteinase [Aeromonas enteropelogenes]UAK71154.1 adenosylhomocysteinase [Aeromonas enteropelogenes]